MSNSKAASRGHIRRWRRLVLFGLGASLILPSLGLPRLVHAVSSTITDLPVYGDWPLTCGWHVNCMPPPWGFDTNAGGVDLGVPSGTLVHAAGHGPGHSPAEVLDSGWHDSYGYHVNIDHGPDISTYAHLGWYFLTAGQRVCRHVAVGYSGASGGSATGPHLHFEGDPSPQQFAPIYGAGSPYDKAHFDYDPYAQPPQSQPRVAHDRVQTQAWTVDEVQRSEFFLHGPVDRPDGWQQGFVGFSYMGEAAGHTWYTQEGSEAVKATWDPILPVADEDWEIYAFIPEDFATSRNAHYVVNWSQGSTWSSTDVYVDQSAYFNEWVRLENADFQSFPTTTPGQWRLSVWLMNDCGAAGDCRGERQLAADAMMFVPSDCGS